MKSAVLCSFFGLQILLAPNTVWAADSDPPSLPNVDMSDWPITGEGMAALDSHLANSDFEINKYIYELLGHVDVETQKLMDDAMLNNQQNPGTDVNSIENMHAELVQSFQTFLEGMNWEMHQRLIQQHMSDNGNHQNSGTVDDLSKETVASLNQMMIEYLESYLAMIRPKDYQAWMNGPMSDPQHSN